MSMQNCIINFESWFIAHGGSESGEKQSDIVLVYKTFVGSDIEKRQTGSTGMPDDTDKI